MFDKWLLDVSLDPYKEIPCFVPYEKYDLVLGMNFLTTRCPGKLIGVIHPGGQEAAEQWCKDHPTWYEDFKGIEHDLGSED